MTSAEKKLLKFFCQLETSKQESLLAFAEFLSHQQSLSDSQDEPIPEPQLIERPENETVVAAIKRLSASYPMLDKPQLLNESSAIMTKYVMQGVKAEVAIDELESLFIKFYEEMVDSIKEKK